jgi:hypothetical protein
MADSKRYLIQRKLKQSADAIQKSFEYVSEVREIFILENKNLPEGNKVYDAYISAAEEAMNHQMSLHTYVTQFHSMI